RPARLQRRLLRARHRIPPHQPRHRAQRKTILRLLHSGESWHLRESSPPGTGLLMPLDASLSFPSISQIAKIYPRHKPSPLELTQFLLDRIARLNPSLNACLTLNSETALKEAAAAESALCSKSHSKSSRDLGPLHGIPISLKDNLYTAGVRTTGGSKILRDFV